MDFETLVRLRKSVRQYEDKKLDPSLIEKCIEAARLAPSACNSQPWSFIVVEDRDLVQKVAEQCVPPVGSMNKFVRTAPVIVVQVMEKTNIQSSIGSMLTDRDYNHIDTGFTMGHFLQAAALGLGTCIIGYFNESKIKELLGIPKKEGSACFAPSVMKGRAKGRYQKENL